jgi:uncharacterized membrane protein YdjX (TVP38/TMEM64 family)
VKKSLVTLQRSGEDNREMLDEPPKKPFPRLQIAVWILCAGSFMYFYYARHDSFENGLRSAAAASVLVAYGLYLLLGSIRGLTLVPSAGLMLLAIPFFAPIPLFLLTLLGILISSTSIYYFSRAKIDRLRSILLKNPMAIVILWSFFPLAPTDLICYLCGVMRVRFDRFILGVLVGEGTICAIYVFLGDNLLRMLHWRE